MARQRHLPRAPIREAIIQIQVAPAVELSLIQKFASSIKNEFGKTTDIWQASFGVQFGQDRAESTATNRVLIGKRLDSESGLEVLQCTVNAFSFSRLTPYLDWGQIRDTAKRLWALYVSSVNPISVTRLAVRYINALPLPLPVAELDDYFTAAPQVPRALPQMMHTFLQRVVITDDATSTFATVIQASDEDTAARSRTNQVTIFFDIDAYQQVNLGSEDANTIWSKFEELRDFKNRVFFEHITEKAAGLFE
jgi:uncharacterized protein (TIGR04255 family)